MSYDQFSSTYHRWQRTPRTSGQAFKDADYASPLEIHVNRRKELLVDALVSIAVVCIFLLCVIR